MAAGPQTQVADVVVPSIFTPYMQLLTETKSRLIQSGALARGEALSALLAGGGLTFNIPSWKDLDDDADNVSTDDVADILQLSESAAVPALPTAFLDAIPKKTGTLKEIGVRLSRNQAWGDSDLAAALAGSDPMAAVADRVASYWARRLQDIFIATWKGVAKDNGANDSGDYANVIAGATYVAGTTDFSAEAALDALVTMGDSDDALGTMMVHSIVYNRMRKNNLIDFIPDSMGVVNIPTFLGRQVIVDDAMPTGTATVLANGTAGDAGTYETWFFGAGAAMLGVGSPSVPTETQREALAGNGGGASVLVSRQEWCLHPRGHAYIGTAPNGGPSNAASTNNLNIATSWNRVFTERKQVKFARLVTRES